MASAEKKERQNGVPTRRLFGAGAASAIAVTGVPRVALTDLYHFLVRGSWLRFIGAFAGTFLTVNAAFAVFYLWLGGITGARPGSFSDAFFFSVQTLTTIGYGVMSPQTLVAHLLVTLETMMGMLGMALVTGLAFTKFSRPRARVLFSNVAVVSSRDGLPTLMFRVANQRRNHVVEAQLRVVLLRTEKTLEGETIRRLYDVSLVRSASPAFILTWTAMHRLTPESPLYGLDPAALKAMNAEILVTLVGIDEATSQMIHARHSYLAEEILWGVRLADLIETLPDGRRRVDYRRFHDVVPAQLPTAANIEPERVSAR